MHNFHGSFSDTPGISMDYQWTCMDNPWIPMDSHGDPRIPPWHRWICMDIHGQRWMPMEFLGYPWTSIDIHE